MSKRRSYLSGEAIVLIFFLIFQPLSGNGQEKDFCSKEDGRNSILIRGEISAGKLFSRPFGNGMMFSLKPIDKGWIIGVNERNQPEFDIARLTLPLHGPNPRFIEGWHFRNSSNTGPNDGSVNVPQESREFIFSPIVHTIFEKGRERNVGMDDIEKIEQYGRGELYMEDYRLSDLEAGMIAGIAYMRFRVCLSWPVD